MLTALLLAPALALADVGPPPTCPPGKHRQYLYGHRCVTDGYHLEATEDGEIIEVSDAPEPSPEPSPPGVGDTITPEAPPSDLTPPPTKPAAPEAPPAAPETPEAPAAPPGEAEAGGCGRSRAVGVLGLSLGLLGLRRRRPLR